MKRFLMLKRSLVLCVSLFSLFFGVMPVAAEAQSDDIFLSESPPQIPEGNINLITTSDGLYDSTKGKIGVTYNRTYNVLANTNDLQSAFIQFANVKGLKSSDTYLFKFKLITKTAQPNPEYNDYTSMGARIIFRGIESGNKDGRTDNYCTFSMFAKSMAVHVYKDKASVVTPLYVNFPRELGKEYDIAILSGPTEVSIWVDGKLCINQKGLPQYDPFFGVNIYRASVVLKNIEVYNINPDNPEDLKQTESNDKLTYIKNTLEGVQGSIPPANQKGRLEFVAGIAVAAFALIMIPIVIILHIRAKKRYKRPNDNET